MKTILKFKNINRFGVELEGAWNDKPKMGKPDGSLKLNYNGYIGEVATKPYKNFSCAKKFINNNYPVKIDESCGYHIHLSTKNENDYELLTHPKFYSDFINFLKTLNKVSLRNYELMDRINGKNTYCRKISKNSLEKTYVSQINWGENRFRQLNFCWGKHRTLENRVFPMFETSEKAIKALEEYLKFVDSWIEDHRFLAKIKNVLVRKN